MLEFDPDSWSLWEFWLYGFALYCAGGLLWYWFRFHGLEAKAKAGDEDARVAFNRVLQGFPNSVYAKMLGKRRLDADEAGTSL